MTEERKRLDCVRNCARECTKLIPPTGYYLPITYLFVSKCKKNTYNTCIYQFKCRILHLIYHKIRILFTHLHTKTKAYVTYCHTSQRKIE